MYLIGQRGGRGGGMGCIPGGRGGDTGSIPGGGGVDIWQDKYKKLIKVRTTPPPWGKWVEVRLV